jgi:hypothetical protein
MSRGLFCLNMAYKVALLGLVALAYVADGEMVVHKKMKKTFAVSTTWNSTNVRYRKR